LHDLIENRSIFYYAIGKTKTDYSLFILTGDVKNCLNLLQGGGNFFINEIESI